MGMSAFSGALKILGNIVPALLPTLRMYAAMKSYGFDGFACITSFKASLTTLSKLYWER
jgi:hypothetical protein